jgi:hypothetical protein
VRIATFILFYYYCIHIFSVAIVNYITILYTVLPLLYSFSFYVLCKLYCIAIREPAGQSALHKPVSSHQSQFLIYNYFVVRPKGPYIYYFVRPKGPYIIVLLRHKARILLLLLLLLFCWVIRIVY